MNEGTIRARTIGSPTSKPAVHETVVKPGTLAREAQLLRDSGGREPPSYREAFGGPHPAFDAPPPPAVP